MHEAAEVCPVSMRLAEAEGDAQMLEIGLVDGRGVWSVKRLDMQGSLPVVPGI